MSDSFCPCMEALSCRSCCCRRRCCSRREQRVQPFSEGKNRDRLILAAQLYTVSDLHLYLPMYPTAWIIRKINKGFCEAYIDARTGYITLRVFGSLVFFIVFLPICYANSMMPYPCAEKDVDLVSGLQESGAVLTLRQRGCDAEDYLRDPASLPFFCSVFVCAIILIALLSFIGSKFIRLEFRLLLFAKTLLPRVFYDGLGPFGSKHSSWAIFKAKGLSEHWSWMHDAFGTVDCVIVTLVLAVLLVVAVAWLGWLEDGVRGVSVGAAMGSVLGRLVFFLMNYILGANSRLIQMIDFELQQFHLDTVYIAQAPDGQLSVMEEELCEVVEKTAQCFEDAFAIDVAKKVRQRGYDVLHTLVKFVMKHKEEYVTLSGMYYHLFTTEGDSFSTNAVELAALTLLDAKTFLRAYFDPGNRVFSDSRRWRTFHLKYVYLASPLNTTCKVTNDEWHLHSVLASDHEQIAKQKETEGIPRVISTRAEDVESGPGAKVVIPGHKQRELSGLSGFVRAWSF